MLFFQRPRDRKFRPELPISIEKYRGELRRGYILLTYYDTNFQSMTTQFY
ncbi:hypothetical protein CKA32_001817 [Geitlerinema sp. FC II]|nr:hypothetical protein CKA32_001817 [Geitlerinema sp. FC II]